MSFITRTIKSFSKFEVGLLAFSVIAVLVAFFVAGSDDYLSLAASLLGAIMLIFIAKGNVIGHVLTLVFCALYAVVSYRNRYYGEMITYLGMTAPIAIMSVVTWLRNSFGGKAEQVRVNTLRAGEYVFLAALAAAVTVAFYFILREFGTSNLVTSTVSVLTSFVAAYLCMRRSELYALAYAANDIVLIVLWVMATVTDIDYIAVAVCFGVFLINDIYGFVCWSRTKKRQASAPPA